MDKIPYPYMVAVEYPHSYRQDWSVTFDTEDEQRKYAQVIVAKSSPWGTEGYAKVTLATITEELN